MAWPKAMSLVTEDSKKRAISCSDGVEKKAKRHTSDYNFDITHIESNNRKKESNTLCDIFA